MIPHIVKNNSIVLFPPNAAPLTIEADHINYGAVYLAISEARWDDAVELASVTNFVNKFTDGAVTVSADGVLYNGIPVNNYLAYKLVSFFNENLPIQHYCLFLTNLMSNPSMTSRNELFMFLEEANLPITEDGCFLAYKAVRHDFRDKHSGIFDNSPGITHEMPRRNVDDDRNRTCSYGFHAAAYEYAKNFLSGIGGRMVAVKINPADVVSVPSDYNNQKLRCCKYTVMFEIPDAADVFKGVNHYDTSVNHTPASTFDAAANKYFWGNVFSEDDDDDFDWDEDGTNNPNYRG